MGKIVFEEGILTCKRGIYGIYILKGNSETCAYVGKSEELPRRCKKHRKTIENQGDKCVHSLKQAYLDSEATIIFRVLAEVPYCFDNYYKDAQRLANSEYFWINYYQNMNQCLEQVPEGKRPSIENWNEMKTQHDEATSINSESNGLEDDTEIRSQNLASADSKSICKVVSNVSVRKVDITTLNVDVVVNAANHGLWKGGGVCGAIFAAAGSSKLNEACRAIGHCSIGKAVITPGFDLPARYIIHAVGPRWEGGIHDEPRLLYDAYKNSLKLAKENGCHSIAFPLISSGIFRYPKEQAWRKAFEACRDFVDKNLGYDMEIIFAVISDEAEALGKSVLTEIEGL